MKKLHEWDVNTRQAVEIQKSLRKKLLLQPLEREVSLIAGADISFNKGSDDTYAGIVLLSYPGMEKVAHALVSFRVGFPYIPGLLSFREIPPLLAAWRLLERLPDVVMLDGHGIAHPRRLGLAAHFGLWVSRPSLGCAKKLLSGMHGSLAAKALAAATIYDQNEKVGVALRSRDEVKPIFVSPGHLIDLPGALQITKNCLRGYRMPEPTRQAHLLVNRLRKGEEKTGFKNYD